MPFGPNGERRAAVPVAYAPLVASIATGDVEDEYVNSGQSVRWRMAQAKGRRSE